jgi:hypothetical protein
MGWWGEMGGPKQKGVVQYSTCILLNGEGEQMGGEGQKRLEGKGGNEEHELTNSPIAIPSKSTFRHVARIRLCWIQSIHAPRPILYHPCFNR